MTDAPLPSFRDLGLSDPLLEALSAVGYESPSPIQARTIPMLLSGSDLLGQAQTGTGKTAAFALPILARLDLSRLAPQALVLVPTRELAIQVSEAFQKYAVRLPGFHVLPIYGGQSYTPQLKGLKRGAHVIVGTPGRVMDHMQSGALKLSDLRILVLDEGDEMLQMGFVDAIEWVLEQAPPTRQIALFSATMPPAIRRIAQKHMRSPAEITIQNKAGSGPKIRQRYWMVSGLNKLDALTRVLEATQFDAMLVFVRTKLETVELAERLEARGFSAAALNGDIPQQQRERTVSHLKSGQIDIVVATDVAARGLDVERISHVVNYDIPYDSETYIHRIGRTGRAGRSGEAILFVAPRERNMLRVIERVTKQPLEELLLPTVADVNEQRAVKFKARITEAVSAGQGRTFEALLKQIEQEQNIPAMDIAMALAGLLQGSTPFLLTPNTPEGSAKAPKAWTPPPRATSDETAPDSAAGKQGKKGHPKRRAPESDVPMESFRIEVGHEHGVQPGNIVGAIANEAGIEGRLIGHIDIRDDHSFVDLPEGVPDEILKSLEKTRIRGQALKIRRVEFKPDRSKRAHPGKPKRKDFGAGHKPARFEHKRKPPRARK